MLWYEYLYFHDVLTLHFNVNFCISRFLYFSLAPNIFVSVMECIRMMIVGDRDVGKTSLLATYISGTFPNEYVPLTLDRYSVIDTFKESKVHLNLFDSGREEDYHRIKFFSVLEPSVFLLCFSVDSLASYECIEKILFPEIFTLCPKVPVVLVATKCDLREGKSADPAEASSSDMFINYEKGLQLSKNIGAVDYVECSSLKNDNVKAVFAKAIEAVFSHAASENKCSIL